MFNSITVTLPCDSNGPATRNDDDFIYATGGIGQYVVTEGCNSAIRGVCLSPENALALATDILNWAQGRGHDADIHAMATAIAEETAPAPDLCEDPECNCRAPKPQGYAALSQQASLIYRHLTRAGSISAREAMNDHGISSATLARRICDLEEAGYTVARTRKIHPITQKRYTRYSIVAG